MFQLSRYEGIISWVLTGKRDWEWAPIFLARISLGLFFAISGYNKLFTQKNHDGLLKTMHEAGIPFPEFITYFLATVEFVGGSLLTLGFLSTLWSIALLIAMIVAIATVEVHTIPKGLAFLNWLDYFLFLPQVMYVLMFIWLIVSGPSPISIDHLIANKLLPPDKTESG